MKKICTFVAMLMLASFAFGQVELIDLEGVFQGKYRYDRLRSLSWRPETSQYTTYDESSNAIILHDLKTGKTQEAYCFDAFDKKENGRHSTVIEWIDKNSFRFYCEKNDQPCYATFHLDTKNIEIRAMVAKDQELVDGGDDLFIYQKEGKDGYFVGSQKNTSNNDIILCPDTGKNIVFGQPVHRSEWGINEGWYFSPKNNYIAFYRMDESMVQDYPLLQTSDGNGAAEIAYIKNIKYPMAGRTSHQVKVGIFDAQQSFKQSKCVYHYIQTDLSDGEFLTNVTFSPDEKYLYIAHLNREQNHSKLIRYEVASGKKMAVLFEETDSRYVEPLTRMIFLSNGNFIWQSDRDGWNHFYLYDFNGNLIKQLTKGNWPVLEAMGLDTKEQNLFFMTNKDNPVDKYLYSVNLANGKLTKITQESGTHTILMSTDKKYYFDYFSNLHTPLKIFAGTTDGKTNKLLLESKNPYGKYELGRDTIFSLKGESGDDLYCEMIYPPHFDASKKYPCLVYVYGGPHSQLVTNTFMTAGVFLNYMAQKGYVIFVMDNRGTSNRGAAFEKCIHRNLGVCESADQMVGVRYLQSLPFIDRDRMGIDGWSFGGFMTLTMITDHPEVFASATCGGPVVNWEWYEIMYGERYMDTPQENPEGYEHACIIPKIKNLKCPLLIMHGQQDNTVVQQHSLELLHQSVLDDVQIFYFPYTTHEHNVMGMDRVQMWHKIEQFHDGNLMKK